MKKIFSIIIGIILCTFVCNAQNDDSITLSIPNNCIIPNKIPPTKITVVKEIDFKDIPIQWGDTCDKTAFLAKLISIEGCTVFPKEITAICILPTVATRRTGDIVTGHSFSIVRNGDFSLFEIGGTKYNNKKYWVFYISYR